MIPMVGMAGCGDHDVMGHDFQADDGVTEDDDEEEEEEQVENEEDAGLHKAPEREESDHGGEWPW